MPKRNPRHLDALRIEVNDRERELIEQAIIVNGISGVARGLGNAVGGLGLAMGAVAAVLVWKEGGDWIKDKMDLGTAEWLAENCSQEKYNAYLQTRTDEWIKAAKKAGRYAPAIDDAENTAWWSALDASRGPVHQALTFTDWEAKAYPGNPPLLYNQWENQQRAEATRERKRKLGYGYFQEWVEAAWAGGTWSPDQPVDRYS